MYTTSNSGSHGAVPKCCALVKSSSYSILQQKKESECISQQQHVRKHEEIVQIKITGKRVIDDTTFTSKQGSLTMFFI